MPEERIMKDVELRLISELMKNSRRSDRDLAKAIGVSQPTVTRIRTKLEKEGYIREYTIIPNFQKLGYHILALNFAKLKGELTPEEIKEIEKITQENLKKEPYKEIVMFLRGLGLGFTAVIASIHKDYSDYVKRFDKMREYPFLDLSKFESFLINLDEKVQYRPPTLRYLANHLSASKKEKRK